MAISCSLLIMFVLITTCSVIAIKYKASQKLLSVKQSRNIEAETEENILEHNFSYNEDLSEKY